MRTRPFLLRILLCLLVSLVPLSELDNRIYDLRLNIGGRAAPPSNVVLIDIEGRDFQQLRERMGQRLYLSGAAAMPMEQLTDVRDLFFWDPQIYSRFLEVAQSDKPSAIVFTLYFPKGAIEPALPKRRAHEIDWMSVLQLRARSTHVLWSSQFDVEGNFLRPADELAAISNFGFNNLWPDRDGVVRRMPLIFDNHASLALAASYVLGHDLSSFRKPEQQQLVNFIGPAGSFKVCRFTDFIEGAEQVAERCGDITDKVLVVGKDVLKQGMGSSFRTPMGEMSRAETIANSIVTLADGRFIRQLDPVAHLFVRLMFILVTATFVLFYPILLATILTTGFGLIAMGPVYQALLAVVGLHIPAMGDAAAILATYLLFTGFKVAYQETLQWKALKQTQVLREVDRLKTNFLSLFSHDLKTPIAKIQGMSELLLREGDLKSAHRDHLRAILKSNNELKEYISSILNLSRVETNKLILNKKSNDINQTIEEVVDRLRFLADQKKITIFRELEPMFSVEYDEELVRQVINNLVDNSIKYSDDGSNVKVRSYEANNAVWVEVSDEGPGIKGQDLDKMFKKFSRLGDPMSEKVRGTGLGLFLSKYFIELHGGTIRVRSPADPVTARGSVFTFSLPIS
jgi:signal transduction histidine kinase